MHCLIMARRSDHTRKELKDLAISAGVEVIEREGVNGFSSRRVAHDIGYSVGTITNVFDGQENFILYINARMLDKWFSTMQAELGRYKGNKPIHNLAKFYISYAKNNYNEWLFLFENHNIKRNKIPKWYQDKLAAFFLEVEKLLKNSLADKKQVKRTARMLWASIHGITVLALSNKLDMAVDESPEALAYMLIDSVC